MSIFNRGGIAYPATSLGFETGTWRVQRPTHRHRSAPCHGACPAGEDAQAYLALVEGRHFREAWETLVAANPLPAITGRVCHHPCETACNRGKFDAPIAIHSVERLLGDEAIREDWSYPIGRPEQSTTRVAVVGAGPAGCSAAYHLLRRGYPVTLFEALSEAGGTLRSAIPRYRLPHEVIDAEIRRVLETGIQFRPNHRLGRDMSLEELRSDFGAVFLGPGNQRSREWSVDGATPRDLHVGLDLLKQWSDVGLVPTYKTVAIVGGGNTAVDLARVLKRAGVREVHIVTHQALPGPGVLPEEAMRAIAREIQQALEEGVVIHEHRGVQRLVLRGERVVGIEMVHMKSLRRSDGRLERVAFEGTETLLHVEQVIPAIGQVVDATGLESLLDHQLFFSIDDWGRFDRQPGVFAGGDAGGGRGTVTHAIGDGRRAAYAIDCYLKDTSVVPSGDQEPVRFEQLNVNYFEHMPRPEEPLLPVEERTGFQEIEFGLSTNQVVGEGQRCFSCGNCMACDNCWTLCPDVAVMKTRERASDGSHYVFDYTYCKGCGLCARECPSGFIAMEEEI